MGQAKELITMDVYADMKEVLPNLEEIERFKMELLEIVVDVTEYLPTAG